MENKNDWTQEHKIIDQILLNNIKIINKYEIKCDHKIIAKSILDNFELDISIKEFSKIIKEMIDFHDQSIIMGSCMMSLTSKIYHQIDLLLL